MINPGVISLASLQNIEYSLFPYRFEIEDNIGEAIHIHYKEIRMDFTIEEFTCLAENMYDIIDNIIDVDGFSSRNFDPVVLVGIIGNLPRLKEVKLRKLMLEDLLVDTFDAEGNSIYASISHSRVYKALCGLNEENDKHVIQFNHFMDKEPAKCTNLDRVMFNLRKIKEHGYPYNNEYIGVDADNHIWDGQHRAACLYYLYGNIEVTVQELVCGETQESMRMNVNSLEQELFFDESRNTSNCVGKWNILSEVRKVLRHFMWPTMIYADDTRKAILEKMERVEYKIDDCIARMEKR